MSSSRYDRCAEARSPAPLGSRNNYFPTAIRFLKQSAQPSNTTLESGTQEIDTCTSVDLLCNCILP